MDALITFLRARLDELEVAAKAMLAVYPTPWELSDRGHMAKITADKPNFAIVIQLDQRQARDAVWLGDPIRHVELNNPDFTLADVAAKHRIIDMHRDEGQGQGYRASDYGYIDHACHMCGTPDEYAVAWPCSTLKALALPFAGHPDYREDWKP